MCAATGRHNPHGVGGILADDMGLGKTAQLAALVTLNHPECAIFNVETAL
jgi:SNF2 family DNA or RNA helicase